MIKYYKKFFQTSVLLFLFFGLFVVAQAETFCQEGEKKCSTRFGGIVEQCGNCDADEDLEWCFFENCADKNSACFAGSCGNIECEDEQLAGDVNNDGYINILDEDMIKQVSENKINEPADLCCVDLDLNGKVDGEDEKIVNQIVVGSINNLGTCREIKEKNINKAGTCNNDGQCGEGENIENCPQDCPKTITKTIEKSEEPKTDNKSIFFLFGIIVLMAIVIVFFIKKRGKGNSSGNNTSTGNTQ